MFRINLGRLGNSWTQKGIGKRPRKPLNGLALPSAATGPPRGESEPAEQQHLLPAPGPGGRRRLCDHPAEGDKSVGEWSVCCRHNP